MPIDDVVSTGYSNIQPSQGAGEAPVQNTEATKNTPEPEQKKTQGEITDDSGSLENSQDEALENESDESEDDESSSYSKADDGKAEGKSNGLKGIEKRIKKLTKTIYEQRSENQILREQLLRQNQITQPQENTQKHNQSQDDGKPNPDNFEHNYEYLEALVDWREQQSHKRAAQQSAQSAFEAKLKKHEERVAEFKASTPDFDLAVQEFQAYNPGVQIRQDIADLVLESELSAPLAYELFKNPSQLLKINQMTAAQASREIGRLESRIERTIEEKKSQTKVVTKTNAPPPLSPIGSSSAAAATQKSIYDMSADEYMEWRKKQK